MKLKKKGNCTKQIWEKSGKINTILWIWILYSSPVSQISPADQSDTHSRSDAFRWNTPHHLSVSRWWYAYRLLSFQSKRDSPRKWKSGEHRWVFQHSVPGRKWGDSKNASCTGSSCHDGFLGFSPVVRNGGKTACKSNLRQENRNVLTVIGRVGCQSPLSPHYLVYQKKCHHHPCPESLSLANSRGCTPNA